MSINREVISEITPLQTLEAQPSHCGGGRGSPYKNHLSHSQNYIPTYLVEIPQPEKSESLTNFVQLLAEDLDHKLNCNLLVDDTRNHCQAGLDIVIDKEVFFKDVPNKTSGDLGFSPPS